MFGRKEKGRFHTVDTSVVRLHVRLFHFSILNHKRVTLASLVSEDGGAVECNIESFREFAGRITEEADLHTIIRVIVSKD